MKKVFTGAILGAVCAAIMFAQAKGKQPGPKEMEALQAIQAATTVQAKIAAVDAFVTKFSDSQFKSWALMNAMVAADQSGDADKTIIYGERTLEADPKSYVAMVTLAETYIKRTREHDLDKEEKLSKADDYSKRAIDAANSAVKDNPQITDEQWTGMKKEVANRAHHAMGNAAMMRKKYDVAATEFKAAADSFAPNPDPTAGARLAAAYKEGGKYDEAIATADQVLAMAGLDPAIKQFTTAVKAEATKAKASGAKPAQSGPAQIEIKK